MSRKIVIAIAIGSALSGWLCESAAADSVPTWDVTVSCRGAAEVGHEQDSKSELETLSRQRTTDA